MAAKTVDEYVAGLPPSQAELVQALRQIVRAAAPQAAETIKLTLGRFSPIPIIRSIR